MSKTRTYRTKARKEKDQFFRQLAELVGNDNAAQLFAEIADSPPSQFCGTEEANRRLFPDKYK